MKARSTHVRASTPLLVAAILIAFTACGHDDTGTVSRIAAHTTHWSDRRDSLAVDPVRDDSNVCSACISVDKVAVLGGSPDSGEAFVSPTFALIRDTRGNYWLNQGKNLKVFGADGRFIRVVGRPGSGPMEWGIPWPVSADAPAGSIRVVDKGNARETIIGSDFRRVSEQPLPSMDMQHVVSLGGDSFVVNAWGTSPEQVAQPLHVVHGAASLHSFGASRNGDPVTPLTARRVIAADRDGHVFSVPDYEYQIEVWTTDGHRMIGFSGPMLNSHPVKPGLFNRDDNPVPNQIQAIQADDTGRLWVLSWHVKPGWQDKLQDHLYKNGRTGLVPKPGMTADSLYFSRIEIIDLDQRQIVARVDRSGLLMGWAGQGLVWENRSDDEKPGVWIWQIAASPSVHRAAGAVQ